MVMDLFRDLSQVTKAIETNEEMAIRISDKDFIRIHDVTESWLFKNKKLCEMHNIAVEDYIVSRYAVLNLGLMRTGLSLAAQAIEKFLKCYLLAAGISMEETRKYSHKIMSIMRKVQEIYKKDELINFQQFCENLEKWYNSRYPDSSDPALQWMRGAIPDLDNFVNYLEENILLPEEIIHLKYAGGEMGNQWGSIFVRLFAGIYSQHRDALLIENIALSYRLNELQEKFFENRLAAVMPSKTLSETKEEIKRVEIVLYKHRETLKNG